MANYYFGARRPRSSQRHYSAKYLRVVYSLLMHRVLGRVDRIIATSPNYVASSPVLQKYADKCVVVPLGIDVARFTGSNESPSHSKRGGQGVRLLFVGQLRYYKGLDHLLRAMIELPHARLVIVGTGPLEQYLRSLSKELRIDDRVEFAIGVQDADLPAHFAACDVFVLPASERSEAFGVVQLEAMAACKPVVCTEVGTGTSFVNLDGETGFVVPARDPHALASAITKLAEEPELRARMGEAGRARVNREFTLEKMVARVMRVYEEVLD
jgi:rhamnosyl/mannosyltransferase